MSQRANPALIGVFVLCGAALAIGAVVVFGRGDLFKQKVPVVMFFDGNINGLAVGAKVKLRGVPVGSVVGIDLPIRTSEQGARIPVFAELSQGRTYTHQELLVQRDKIENAIDRGLRARLDSESFVTGVLYVDLDLQPDQPAVLIGSGPDGFVEIPTLPPRIGEVIRKLLASLDEIDLKQLVDSITSAARGIDELVRSPRIDQGFDSADRTLQRYRDLAQTLDTNVKSLAKEIESAMASARGAFEQTERTMKTGESALSDLHDAADSFRQDSKAIVNAVKSAADSTRDVEQRLQGTLANVQDVIDPRAPLVQQLQETLHELGRAARGLAAFADELDRDPSVLVRGRETEGQKR
jgi:paraquat-inducible protein B